MAQSGPLVDHGICTNWRRHNLLSCTTVCQHLSRLWLRQIFPREQLRVLRGAAESAVLQRSAGQRPGQVIVGVELAQDVQETLQRLLGGGHLLGARARVPWYLCHLIRD